MFSISERTGNAVHEYSADEFEERFLEICRAHREEGRAMVFAFLLYDLHHPHVAKVLNDPDYWAALNHSAGTNITVFAYHSPPVIEPRPRTDDDDLGFMLAVQGDRRRADKIVERYFTLDPAPELPCLLFFQVAQDRVIEAMVVEVDSDTVEGAFNEIHRVVKDVSTSLNDVTEENQGNAEEIFALTRGALERRNARITIIKVGKRLLALVSHAKTVFDMM